MRASMGPGHHQGARSSDMGSFSSGAPLSRSIRPASEIFYNPVQQSPGFQSQEEPVHTEPQDWIAVINEYETTLEEMAAATLDQEFKDELGAIEQWFQVLSEPERTAALYALLQHTTQIQIKFFNAVLSQMAESHPAAGQLIPSNFGNDKGMRAYAMQAVALTNAEITASKRMSMTASRPNGDSTIEKHLNPGGRSGVNNKRNSTLDMVEISSMFPDAAAALEKKKAEFSQQQQQNGTAASKRSSMMFDNRSSLLGANLGSSFEDKKDPFSPRPPPSPWGARVSEMTLPSRPKSTTGQQPMGQFSQPSPSAPMRSPRPMTLGGADASVYANALGTDPNTGMPLFSPFPPGASWGSISNTPMLPNFNLQQSQNNQAELVANATAMKLQALSTVNNRLTLDDPRKYRRARSSDDQPKTQSLSAATLPTQFIMTNELGQVLTPQQAQAIQAQQLAALASRASRPNSPGMAMQGVGMGGMSMAGAQNHGLLSAYDPGHTNLLNLGMAGLNLNMGQFTGGLGAGEGYISDASEINRGRSPRGKRGSSRPPEDPTDLELLKDIPAWLRSLRLHKYTDNLKDVPWQELILLDDEGLEAKGVSAVGARRKMTKVFEEVRKAQDHGKLANMGT
jgi:hypothetical protein